MTVSFRNFIYFFFSTLDPPLTASRQTPMPFLLAGATAHAHAGDHPGLESSTLDLKRGAPGHTGPSNVHHVPRSRIAEQKKRGAFE